MEYKTTQLAGIDGCKGGWIFVSSNREEYTLELYKNFKSLLIDNPKLKRILIDIPVGLASASFPRTIESTMRKELKNRHSTVFNSPCRFAVYEEDDLKARKINMRIEDKSLSIQSLAIRNKIKEVDEFLLNREGNKVEIIESHPELCFKYLKNSVLQTKKSTKLGADERLKIIGKYEPKLVKLYQIKEKQIKRKYAKKDDLIDAICLYLVNKLGFMDQLSYFTDVNSIDEKQILVKIGYYKPRK